MNQGFGGVSHHGGQEVGFCFALRHTQGPGLELAGTRELVLQAGMVRQIGGHARRGAEQQLEGSQWTGH